MVYSFEVKVIPSSGKSLISVDASGTIKCYLKSAPEKGAANNELIKLLAKKLSIMQQQVVIIMGETSRKKIIKVTIDCSKQEMMDQLGVSKQLSMFE